MRFLISYDQKKRAKVQSRAQPVFYLRCFALYARSRQNYNPGVCLINQLLFNIRGKPVGVVGVVCFLLGVSRSCS